MSPSPICDGVLTGYPVCKQGCCEFITVTTMSCPEDGISQHCSPPAISTFFPLPRFPLRHSALAAGFKSPFISFILDTTMRRSRYEANRDDSLEARGRWAVTLLVGAFNLEYSLRGSCIKLEQPYTHHGADPQ